MYEVHGARGEDPTEPPSSAPYPFPAVSHEPRIQQLSDDLEAAGFHPFHAPCGIRARRVGHAAQRVHPVRELRRLPLSRARQVGRRGARRAAGARAPERRRCCTNAHGQARDRTRPARSVTERRGRARRRHGDASRGDIVVARVRCGEHGQAAPGLGERPAPERPGQRLGPGRPQLHVPRQHGGARALARREPDRLPEDARRSTTSTSRATTSSTRSGTSRWSASRRRRCSAARSRARRSSRPSGRLERVARHAIDFWLSTEDLPPAREPGDGRPRTAS